MLDSAAPLCALIAPTVNSYRRLNAAGTLSGRPGRHDGERFREQPDAHGAHSGAGPVRGSRVGRLGEPVPATAAVLEACRHGIERQLTAGAVSDINVYDRGEATSDLKPLPTTLLDALRAFEFEPPLRAALGEPFATAYLKHKHASGWNRCGTSRTGEREKTLDC